MKTIVMGLHFFCDFLNDRLSLLTMGAGFLKLNFLGFDAAPEVPATGLPKELFSEVETNELSKLNAESLDRKMSSSLSSLLSVNLSGIGFWLLGRNCFGAFGLDILLAIL